MTRFEAVQCVLRCLEPATVVVAANGFISRDVCRAADRELNFYMIGSMGLASSIGLGIALCEPDTRVVVLDGDGNVLMGFSAIPMVGAWKPDYFTHIVLDNRCYASTGGQSTISESVDFCKTALASGYCGAFTVRDEADLAGALESARMLRGPLLLHVKISSEEQFSPRVPDALWQEGERFRQAFFRVRSQGIPNNACVRDD